MARVSAFSTAKNSVSCRALTRRNISRPHAVIEGKGAHSLYSAPVGKQGRISVGWRNIAALKEFSKGTPFKEEIQTSSRLSYYEVVGYFDAQQAHGKGRYTIEIRCPDLLVRVEIDRGGIVRKVRQHYARIEMVQRLPEFPYKAVVMTAMNAFEAARGSTRTTRV